MMGTMAWVKVIVQNRKTIFKLVLQGIKAGAWKGAPALVIPGVTVASIPALDGQVQISEG
jgi:hypothetical protein